MGKITKKCLCCSYDDVYLLCVRCQSNGVVCFGLKAKCLIYARNTYIIHKCTEFDLFRCKKKRFLTTCATPNDSSALVVYDTKRTRSEFCFGSTRWNRRRKSHRHTVFTECDTQIHIICMFMWKSHVFALSFCFGHGTIYPSALNWTMVTNMLFLVYSRWPYVIPRYFNVMRLLLNCQIMKSESMGSYFDGHILRTLPADGARLLRQCFHSFVHIFEQNDSIYSTYFDGNNFVCFESQIPPPLSIEHTLLQWSRPNLCYKLK